MRGRAAYADIESCGKAPAKAARPRIHTGIGVSDIHIMAKLRDERYGKTLGGKKAKLMTLAVDAVKCAPTAAATFSSTPRMPPRPPLYLFEMLEAVIDTGAMVDNIPDTTGYTVPEQYGELIRSIRDNVPNIPRATISVHCHDDLGLAVANSLAGIRNGALQVEGTINGIGESERQKAKLQDRNGRWSKHPVHNSIKLRFGPTSNLSMPGWTRWRRSPKPE